MRVKYRLHHAVTNIDITLRKMWMTYRLHHATTYYR